MNEKEQAEKIWKAIYTEELDTKDDGIALIMSFVDAIRRECAEKAVRSFLRCMAESDIAAGNDYVVLVISDKIRAAILAIEPAREGS